MGKYLVKRGLLLVITLVLVCLIVFALMRMIPGSAVDVIISSYATHGIVVDRYEVEQKLGLDKPFFVQFFNWGSDLVQGNLGDSLFQPESVAAIIGRTLPVTLELTVLMLFFTNIISIPLGLYCAARQDTISDNMIRAIGVILMSLPVFWLATLVLVYPAVWWSYAPPTKFVGLFENPIQNLQMLIVPAMLGAIAQAGAQLRSVRTMTLEVMRQDYVRTAWAKGVGEKRILFVHALRNAMILVITIIGGSIAASIGGSVILETMFSMPGLGQQMVSALGNRDYPLVQGCVLILSIIVMVVNLIVDIAYKWIDPRVEIE